jgi:hypothetical protein
MPLDLLLSTAPYGGGQGLPCGKRLNMRKAKYVVVACLMVLQVAVAVRFAAAVPMAHGTWDSDVTAPEFSVPGGLLDFSATALNDGGATGWFRICVVKVGPPYHEYFPNPLDQVTSERAVHCSKTVPTDPGQTMTFDSQKFRMMSVANETFWVLLTVQQQAPIMSDDGSDLTNLTVDELTQVVVTNLFA